MMPAVGDSPLFIGALQDLVLRAVGLQEAAISLGQASTSLANAASELRP
jgi:hypothetical protein